jgi:hypothetical protein
LFIKYLYEKYINMRQFRIDDSERDRILNLHENATKRQYLKEDSGNYDLVSSKGVSIRLLLHLTEVFN